MEIISKMLFGIANSLLIPDIILLIVFFIRALFLLGSTYNQFMVRRRNNRRLAMTIKELHPSDIDALRNLLPEKHDSLFTEYLADILEHPASEAYTDYLLTQYETEVAKDVNLSRLLTKLGPVLGLIGDISGMAYNMQVVFSATVVGLVISAVGLFTQQLKTRWYAKDVNNLDFVSRIYAESHEKEA